MEILNLAVFAELVRQIFLGCFLMDVRNQYYPALNSCKFLWSAQMIGGDRKPQALHAYKKEVINEGSTPGRIVKFASESRNK